LWNYVVALPEISKSAMQSTFDHVRKYCRQQQPDHTHSGNVSTALARKAVGEMKTKMNDMNATSSTSHAAVTAALDNDVLKALPKRKTVARSLQRA